MMNYSRSMSYFWCRDTRFLADPMFWRDFTSIEQSPGSALARRGRQVLQLRSTCRTRQTISTWAFHRSKSVDGLFSAGSDWSDATLIESACLSPHIEVWIATNKVRYEVLCERLAPPSSLIMQIFTISMKNHEQLIFFYGSNGTSSIFSLKVSCE